MRDWPLHRQGYWIGRVEENAGPRGSHTGRLGRGTGPGRSRNDAYPTNAHPMESADYMRFGGFVAFYQEEKEFQEIGGSNSTDQ
jgi:hypothetical protein